MTSGAVGHSRPAAARSTPDPVRRSGCPGYLGGQVPQQLRAGRRSLDRPPRTGTPVARRGRKATGLPESAGLPNEGVRAMFWDGERWLPDDGRPQPQPRTQPSRRVRDWLATGVMVLVLVGLMVPVCRRLGVADARHGRCWPLVRHGSHGRRRPGVEQPDQLPRHAGSTVLYSDYLGGKAQATNASRGDGQPQVHGCRRVAGSAPSVRRAARPRSTSTATLVATVEHLGLVLPPHPRAVPDVVEHCRDAPHHDRRVRHGRPSDGRPRRLPRPPRPGESGRARGQCRCPDRDAAARFTFADGDRCTHLCTHRRPDGRANGRSQ